MRQKEHKQWLNQPPKGITIKLYGNREPVKYRKPPNDMQISRGAFCRLASPPLRLTKRTHSANNQSYRTKFEGPQSPRTMMMAESREDQRCLSSVIESGYNQIRQIID